jgi:hypothetical protein
MAECSVAWGGLPAAEIDRVRTLADVAGIRLGAGVTLIQYDEGWQFDHPAFARFRAEGGTIEWLGRGRIDAGRAAHGTAALAMQIGARVGEPLLPGARVVLAQAIDRDDLPVGRFLQRAIESVAGAAVVLIARDWSSRAPHIPLELRPGIAEVIAQAVARGCLVIEAAGNGGVDLDRLVRRDGAGVTGQIGPAGDSWQRASDRIAPAFSGDSGAIVVGAATATTPRARWTAGFPTNPQPRSNVGGRIDCWATGESIATATLDAAGRPAWTESFGGTSAAATSVAAMAAIALSHTPQGDRPAVAASFRRAVRDPANGDPVFDGGRAIGHAPRLGSVLDALLSR